MRDSVRAAARAFTTAFEGEVPEMYVDVLGLVTCGIGNLIDPLPVSLSLPWRRRSDDGLALPSEIMTEWHAVKDGKLAWYPRRPPRPIYLSADALEALFFLKLDQNETYLARRWANWDQAPADAQLGAHSNAWAAGPAWRAPKFDRAFASGDFHACAGSPGTRGDDPSMRGLAWLKDDGNPGLRKRNLANQYLFQNAAVVLSDGYDPDRLVWPTTLDG